MQKITQGLWAAGLIAALIGASACKRSQTVPDETDTDIEGDTADTADTGTVEPERAWDDFAFATIYEVGPGHEYAELSDVPWETLTPSTVVRVYWRDQPYAATVLIDVEASSEAPVVLLGIPDQGRQPVITGVDAIARQGWGANTEGVAVVQIGSALDAKETRPSWIYVEDLEIRGARDTSTFIASDGTITSFTSTAAALRVDEGSEITLSRLTLTDSAYGLYTGPNSGDVRLAYSYVYGNGNVDRTTESNSRTESVGMLYEYNRFGPLCAGCLGSNLTDRSSSAVIRYNWIEGGNRQIDLVDSRNSAIYSDPSYLTSFVYGNVLLEPTEDGSATIVRYGGDTGALNDYRHGLLYFYHNTVVSGREDAVTLLELVTEVQSADVRNNIVHAAGPLAIGTLDGYVLLRANWLDEGWTTSHATWEGELEDQDNIVGTDPGFAYAAAQDYTLADGSAALDAARSLPNAAQGHEVRRQYVLHQDGKDRRTKQLPDIGAFER